MSKTIFIHCVVSIDRGKQTSFSNVPPFFPIMSFLRSHCGSDSSPLSDSTCASSFYHLVCVLVLYHCLSIIKIVWSRTRFSPPSLKPTKLFSPFFKPVHLPQCFASDQIFLWDGSISWENCQVYLLLWLEEEERSSFSDVVAPSCGPTDVWALQERKHADDMLWFF